MMNFRFSVDHDRGAIIVAPAGRLDSTTSASFDQHMAALVTAGERRIVVDFSEVEYISSAGLRVLLLLAKQMRVDHGRLALCGLGDRVRQVFELAGFLPLFVIASTRAAAVDQIAA
jgi:anti-anti-sigma factor